ncbi:MAG: copper chaperone PCu(A)C [Burkholderiaceae bacterium]|jgi:copper(I)-binding protein|nr:copper chaperone PCu(A)C [Burkholderiaceae bacterium]
MREIKILLSAAALLLAGSVMAQTVKVEGAWARATVPGQQASGAFMTLTAPEGARLVGARSPAASVAEVHEMALQGDVMKMRAVTVLDLPAGQPVELKPGGYHVMLMELKAPLAPGSSVPLTLLLRDANGAEFRQDVQLPVRAAPPADPHKN